MGWLEHAGTNAFQDRPETDLEELGVPAVAVSVHLESVMRQRGITANDLVQRWGEKYGFASILAGEARTLGQGIVRSPTPDAPEHGMIFCEGRSKEDRWSKQAAREAIKSCHCPTASGVGGQLLASRKVRSPLEVDPQDVQKSLA